MSETILKVKDLGLYFNNRKVLKNISFEVNEGEFIGLIGANGAGKSTLLKVILGFLHPDQGNVSIEGKEKDIIGYVPQKVLFDPNLPLRGRDLVKLGINGNKFGFPFPNKDDDRRVEEILKAVDALRFADTPVGFLSGGEQQRLLIAQALLSNPKILLLDEPLANLDIKSAYEIVHLVSHISKEKKVAVILVAHDMNPLLGIMDKVLYIAQGSAVMGTVDEVFKNEVLSRLYGFPVEVLHINGRIMVIGGEESDMNGYPVEGNCCDSEDGK